MTTIPPPNVFNSGATDCPLEEPAAPPRQSDGAAAGYVDLDQYCIGEIFVGARKLDAEESRFVLDVDRFMAELDEPPLFLRQA